MEGNKDESERCISIALSSLSAGNTHKAEKFLKKALKLYPSKRAQDLLDKLSHHSEEDNIPNGTSEESTFRNRKRSASLGRNKNVSAGDGGHTEKHYTDEQYQLVKQVKSCKCFYEVLELQKDATDTDIKKAYRKLALKLHPDKNQAPGASEAFKAVGTAFATLSDSSKRKRYDTYGTDDPHHLTSSHRSYQNDFEPEVTPEEIFNMFFGSPFGSSPFIHRVSTHNRRRTFHGERTQENGSISSLVLQFAPILILIGLSLLSGFLVSDPSYSLTRSSKYTIERRTSLLRLSYFVKPDFVSSFHGSLRKLERSIDEEILSELRGSCFRERTYKDNMKWRAQNMGNTKLYKQAEQMKLSNCDRLRELEARRNG